MTMQTTLFCCITYRHNTFKYRNVSILPLFLEGLHISCGRVGKRVRDKDRGPRLAKYRYSDLSLTHVVIPYSEFMPLLTWREVLNLINEGHLHLRAVTGRSLNCLTAIDCGYLCKYNFILPKPSGCQPTWAVLLFIQVEYTVSEISN